MHKAKLYAVAASGIAVVGAMSFTAATNSASATDDTSRIEVRTHGGLNPLNNSGATGHAHIDVSKKAVLDVDVDARGVVKGMPHAMHVHFGKDARHECPNVAKDDTNGDFRLTTSEGAPAYGPVRVALTKSGDTSPANVLAVDRFPTAPKGMIHYDRNIKVGPRLAAAIERGRAVVVIHGVDYNGNGEYDFYSAGKSDLNPDLPAEATDPAVCGVLHR